MTFIQNWAIPTLICSIVLFGLFRHVAVFDTFVEGASEGFQSCIRILPTLVGLIMAVSMLKSSGALDMLASLLAPLARILGLPQELMPLVLMKPISGSGSNAMLMQLFKSYTPDSFIGRAASVLAGSTETTFYCIAVYYGAIHVKQTRHTIPAALLANLSVCFLASLAVRLIFT